MSKSPVSRVYALALSALLTLCTLGGIDQLAVHPADGAGQWAHQSTTPRA